MVLIGVAGAAGALSRYGLASAIGSRSFPWSTLGINVAGSLLLGFVLAGPGIDRWSATTTTAVSVGFLGAFTTFSTFTYETMALVRDDRPLSALAYVAASLGLGLGAAVLGFVLGRATA